MSHQIWIFLFSALLLSPTVFAVRCGDVLSRSVVLTEDLNCTETRALTVARDGVVIDLNGHTLNAIASTPQVGVFMRDVASVTIKGPGRIHDFFDGVYALRSRSLIVENVEFSDVAAHPAGHEGGVVLAYSTQSTIRNNVFKLHRTSFAILVEQPDDLTGSGAGEHKIQNNYFETATHGVFLCGADAGNNRIERNRFARSHVAVWATYQADGNTILNNTFEVAPLVGVWLETNNNLVGDNVIHAHNHGVFLHATTPATTPGSCRTRPRPTEVFGNSIVRNTISAVDGIILGVRFHEPGSVIRNNLIQKNRFENVGTGIDFAPNTRVNYAKPNTFIDVLTPVRDAGVGNVY